MVVPYSHLPPSSTSNHIFKTNIDASNVFFNIDSLKKLALVIKNGIPELIPAYNMLLQYIADHPGAYAYEINPPKKLEDKEYSIAKKGLARLLKLKLIEIDIDKKDSDRRGKKYYKLSIYGICYLILTDKRPAPDHTIIKSLLKNYDDNILFQLFLYSYVTKETLSQIIDSGFFSQIYSYLRQCCKEVEFWFYSCITNSIFCNNGYLTEQVLAWPTESGTSYETTNLRDYLKRKFGYDWIYESKIKMLREKDSLEIDGKLMLSLDLINNKTKAILKHNNKKIAEFLVRPYDTFLSIEGQTNLPIEELALFSFHLNHELILSKFILSLNQSIGIHSADFSISVQDERFQQVLEKTKEFMINGNNNAFLTEVYINDFGFLISKFLSSYIT